MPADPTPQLQSHEDRLQRVEGNLETVRVTVAEVAVKQDHLSDQIRQGFSGLRDDRHDLHTRLEDHAKRLQAHDARLKPVE